MNYCCEITSQDDKQNVMSGFKLFCAFQTLHSAEVVRGHRVAAPASLLTACKYVHLQSASSCHAVNCSTRPPCQTELLSQKVQSHSCPHQTQPDGIKDSRELQTQACRPAQTEHPLPAPMRSFGGAVQRCGCPLGQREQIQCTSLVLPRVMSSG